MNASAPFLNPAAAARRLGVSSKALRLYEERGLLEPARTAAGWRAYGPDEMARARDIVALRVLGLSLAQVARVLAGDPQALEAALATHQDTLQSQVGRLDATIAKVRGLRAELARGAAPDAGDLVRLLGRTPAPAAAFDLPWPWGGERFELHDLRPLTYIVGPLGSGKTRLAKRIAETLPGAAFLGLERLEDGGRAAAWRLAEDAALKARVDQVLGWLTEDGAEVSEALIALLAGIEADGATAVVVDMIEQGLGQATQQAVAAHLRARGPMARPLLLMTRSSAILDLGDIGPAEAIILCPANHSPPSWVAPYPGASGYDVVATCLGSPEVRARTEGLIALRPQVV